MAADVVDIGVDYVTLTARGGGTASRLLEAAETMFHVEHSVLRIEPKPAAISGYRGYQGAQVYAGEREDGVMVRCSGQAAGGILLLLGEGAKDARCSRIDFQVTGKLEWDNRWYAQQTAQKARASAHGAAKGRPCNVSLIDGGARGSTCTLGARASARFIRIYDKSREQGEGVDSNLWRWEVEYKKPLSDVMLTELLNTENQQNYIRAMVYAECYVKGVHIPWEVDERVDVARIGHTPTSVERSLAWLRTMVRPTVQRLADGGYIEDVISALGLGPVDETDNP